MPSAGAIAAPAITVISDIERMVAVTRFDTLFCFISLIGSFSSTKLSGFEKSGAKLPKIVKSSGPKTR